LSKAVLQRLAELSPENAATFGLDVARTIQNDAELDSLLKVILLSHVLKSAQDAGEVTEQALSEPLKTLRAVNAEEVPWMNPDDPSVANAGEFAVQVLRRLPDVQSLGRDVRSRDQTLARSLGAQLIKSGVLLHDRDRSRIAFPSDLPAGEFELWALTSGGTDRRELIQVGIVKDGHARLADAIKQFGDGERVFAVKTNR
jgi:hypothetical protein